MIIDKVENGDDFVDITDQFFSSVGRIASGEVVKSDLFNLIESTRAVEVNNDKLDTTFIELTSAEVDFDTSKPQNSVSIIGVMNLLLLQYVGWISNSTLISTVLSSRYVYTLLSNYLNDNESTTLESLKSKCDYDKTCHEYLLIHKVLRSYIMGICKLINLSFEISVNTLNEDEDISTRNYGLNFLSNLSVTKIEEAIDESISYISKSTESDYHKDIIISFLNLVKHLCSLDKITSINSQGLNSSGESKSFEVKHINFLDNSIDCIEKLKDIDFQSFPYPEGSFSRFVQVDYSVESIPEKIKLTFDTNGYLELLNMLQVIRNFISQSFKITSPFELEQYLIYDISKQIPTSFNSICRGIFQLFLIREDKSILGSKEDINSLSIGYLKFFNCMYNSLFFPETWTSIQGPESFVKDTKTVIFNKINQLVNDIETGIYHNMVALTNNRCRQRQLLTRSIVIWDTLQANSEILEMDLWSTYSIGEKFEGPNIPANLVEQPCLALSTFIFVEKLRIMIEVALSGIELEVYRPFEWAIIFWYVNYLCKSLLDIYHTRICSAYVSKRYFFESVLPKRIKKLKAGQKKQVLKQLHEQGLNEILPKCDANLKIHQDYYIQQYSGLFHLTDATKTMFSLFHSLDLINLLPSFPMCSPAMMFGLCMKPWSSIGVPETPTYDQYRANITSLALSKDSERKSSQIISLCTSIVKNLKKAKSIYSKIIQDLENEKSKIEMSQNKIQWYNNLTKTCVSYSICINCLEKEAIKNNLANCSLGFKDGYSPFFPTPVLNVT